MEPPPPSPPPPPLPSSHSKPCTICHNPRDVLVRCQTSPTSPWQFVCPGKCWRSLSGGVVDGDAAHPNYRYGGMWKNKHSGASAKMPRKAKEKQRRQKPDTAMKHTDHSNGAEEQEGASKNKTAVELLEPSPPSPPPIATTTTQSNPST